ncbi:MAG: heme ABC transporter ATP-binding protein [Burkholderiales bacterium]|nr:heme ABC transporter ATP-binding protein [Burkholderiales bacterium]
MLTAHDLVFQAGKRALVDRASVSLAPGEVVAVLGENGAGKSTLLRLLAGERAPHAGTITLDGTPLACFSAAALARRRAVLPQDTRVAFGYSALEVVLLGRYPWTHGAPGSGDVALARAVLARVDAAHLESRLITTLSGGERARVHLARTVVQLVGDTPDARFLLLDEPTASLDLAHQHLALGLVRELARERRTGVLAVLHDLNLAAQYADRILLLKQGRVVADGAPDAVLSESLVSFAFSVRALVVPHPAGGRPLVVTTP